MKFSCECHGNIYLQDLKTYDHYEEYDSEKEYEYNNYKHDYGFGEKNYENILLSGNYYEEKELIDQKKFVVAKEIYSEEELKQLEKYCDCVTCKAEKIYTHMQLYDHIIHYIICSLIIIFEFFGINAFFLSNYLYYNRVCPCCCGCIKSGPGYASISQVKKARELNFFKSE